MLQKERKKRLDANIWKFYIYRLFSCLIFSNAVFVLFLLENKMSMTQVMMLQAIYTAVTMIALVPAGIFADYIGRKKTLIIESFIFVLSWAMYSVSDDFFSFAIAEVVMALSAALWMAAGTAFFYDSLKESGDAKTFKKRYGYVSAVNYLTWGIAAAVGGLIAYYGLRSTLYTTAIGVSITILISFFFTETKKYKHADTHYLKHLKDAISFASKHPKVKVYIIYSSIYMATAFSVFFLLQPYMISIGVTLALIGLMFFFMNIAAAIGSMLSDRLENRFKESILVLSVLIPSICYLGMAMQVPWLGLLFPLIISFNGGLFDPVINDYINKYTESHHRSTVLSLQNVIYQLLCTIIAPIVGFIADGFGLAYAYSFGMLLMIANFFLIIRWLNK